MELYKEILCHALQDSRIEVTFPDLKPASDLFGEVCYRTLKKIKEVLENHEKSDGECFESIENIIEIFESIGCSIHGRHDYG